MQFVLPVEEGIGGGGFWGVRQKLQDLIESQLKDLSGKLPPKEVVIAAAKAAYEKYILPLDIPYLPDALVDPILEKLFLDIVGRIYDRFATAK